MAYTVPTDTFPAGFGRRLDAEFVGGDGYARAVVLAQAGWAGAVGRVPGLPPDGGVVVSRDAGHPLAPVVATRMQLRWKDAGVSRPLAGLPYGDVRAALLVDLDGDGTPETGEWAGVLVPGRYSAVPGDPAADTELGFNCGLGLLGGVAAVDPTGPGYDGAATASMRARLDGALSVAATATAPADPDLPWRPTWADGAALTGGPLDALVSRDGAWADPDGAAARADYLVRSVAGRLGLRLVQVPGAVGQRAAWALVSREALAASADAVDARDTFGAALGRPGLDGSLAGVREESDLVVATSESHREFARPLSDAVLNGSFEDGVGVGAGSTADAWALAGGATRYDMTAFDPAAEDRYGVEVPDGATATQAAGVVVAAGADGRYRMAGTLVNFAVVPTIAVRAGASSLRLGRVRVRPSLKGRSVTLQATGALLQNTTPDQFESSGRFADSDAVRGTPVVPEGAVIRFTTPPTAETPEGGAFDLRLTRPARVGDVTLTGDLDDSFEAEASGTFAYWGPPTGVDEPFPPSVAVSAAVQPSAWDYLSYAFDVAGQPVGGAVRVVLYGGGAFGPVVYDDLLLAVEVAAGRAAEGSVTRGATAVRGEGAVSLPVADRRGWPLGDGPLPDAPDAVLADTGAGRRLTGGAEDAGWSGAGGLAAGSIDGLAVASALAQLGGSPAPAVWAGRLLLRSGARYDLTRPLRLYHPDGAGSWRSARYGWDTLVHDVTAGTLDVTATELRLTPQAVTLTYELS